MMQQKARQWSQRISEVEQERGGIRKLDFRHMRFLSNPGKVHRTTCTPPPDQLQDNSWVHGVYDLPRVRHRDDLCERCRTGNNRGHGILDTTEHLFKDRYGQSRNRQIPL